MANLSQITIMTETLIGLLDACAPDPDLEDSADYELTGDDEPNLGAPNQQAGSWNGIDASLGGDDDEELELGWTEQEARWNRYSGAGDDVYEPSLGSTLSMDQAHWSKGGTDDCEEEHDGREPDCDDEDGNDDEWELGWTDLQARTGKYIYGLGWYVADGEPSLASMNRLNQTYWWQGRNDDDREEQCEDEGAIDTDKEPDRDGEGTGNYMGQCSPPATMFPKAN
ncbi:MAG: hypothetical protein K8F25_13220 [Fimbriimonadaceae bacterium]|nr:hypothetical protein [Alphaproteobacteria bacterium]